MNCVDVCPVADTLDLKSLLPKKKKINKKAVAIGVVSIFMIINGFGMILGKWQNNITREEYLYLYKNINTFGHPTSTEAVEKFNEAHPRPFPKGRVEPLGMNKNGKVSDKNIPGSKIEKNISN
jgi:hypothetical protein